MCNSLGVKEYFDKQLFFKKSKAVTINKGHDTSWYASYQPSKIKEELGLPDDAFLLINVANNRKMKGIPYLMKTIALLPKSKNIHLLLVGKGMKTRENTTILKDAGCQDRVHFLGFRKDVLNIVAASNVFVLSSLFGESITKSVIEYINEQYDPAMGWKDAEYCAKKWNGPFALKGVMSVEDAKRAIDIGCTAIMISNHGGRQLDGSRSPFDQVKAISDAVGDKLEIILDGGVRRGTHVLKALAAGAKACSFGKMFLFSLAAGGQQGVEHLLQNMHDEIRRNMVLMGCKNLSELDSTKIVYRN